MRLAHVAIWTRDLDAAATFWATVLGAEIGEAYRSTRRPGFVSRFVRLPGDGATVELMTAPWIEEIPDREAMGWDHVAISLGSIKAVDALSRRCDDLGILLAAPRRTGDGFYEAVIETPDGARVEVTA